MKKIFTSLIVCIAAVIFMIGTAGAWGIPIGNLDIDIYAQNDDKSGAFDFSFSPFGIAIGGGSMDAGVEGGATGFIVNGTITADMPLVANFAGGNSQSGKTDNLGTWTRNLAMTGAQLDVTASTPFIGIGGVAGGASGYAEQHSYNFGGGLANGGLTGGTAGQESAGGFSGDAGVGVVLFWGGGAGFDASIAMEGYSATDSYTLSGGGKGLGTNVMATTDVISSGGSYDTGLGHAYIGGGFIASGGVGSLTAQNYNGGTATASANGSYSGAGSLGTTYTGLANGGTATFAGDNGVMQAGAGMTVTSTITHTVD